MSFDCFNFVLVSIEQVPVHGPVRLYSLIYKFSKLQVLSEQTPKRVMFKNLLGKS
jgi:hypothetical protein